MTDEEHDQNQRDEQGEGGFSLIGDVLPGLFPQLINGGVFSQPDNTPKARATKRRAGEKPTSSNATLAKAAAEIIARPDKAEAAYLARELVQCTLPHRDPGAVPAWVRRNGNFSLVLQPGFDEKAMKPRGLPYGSIPRLLLIWIVTEAVRTKSRHIKLSNSLSGFLREIGLDPNTGRGKRGDAKRLKDQMLRLLDCHISFRYNEGDELAGSRTKIGMEIAPKSKLWWDFRNPNQAALFESELILGEDFFAAIIENPVPFDFRALKALKQSSFAIDVYTWVTYRVFKLQQIGQRQVTIPLESLKEQFGAEYGRLRDFKAALEETLAKVQRVFPALDYSIEKNALILRDGKARAMPTREERRALPKERAQRMAREISPRTREWFALNYPRYDLEEAIRDFDHWRETRHIESKDNDAHFKSFVEKWAK